MLMIEVVKLSHLFQMSFATQRYFRYLTSELMLHGLQDVVFRPSGQSQGSVNLHISPLPD